MEKVRRAVCPACSTEVTVTYWPYNIPLYTVHNIQNTNRECRQSLRPIDRPDADRPRPAR
jgi:Zn ribbon nucleic-acid-binding protein